MQMRPLELQIGPDGDVPRTLRDVFGTSWGRNFAERNVKLVKPGVFMSKLDK